MSHTCKNPVEMTVIQFIIAAYHLEDLDYPKSKIGNFLHNYLLNTRYLMQKI